jgi:hypothetical protein
MGLVRKLKAVKQLPFAVHRKPFVTQAPAKHCRTELTLAAQAKLFLQNPSKLIQRQPKNAEF